MVRTEDVKLRESMNGTPMDVTSFLHIAVGLTECVHRAHKQDTLIGNLNPAEIQIRLDTKAVVLTDRRLADYTYISPEQTGRINRVPDERSDLYALGIIFYEMLSGRLPFHAQSTEDWIHVHLAVIPRPLRELCSDLESPLEALIMKLLLKNPEERYQSAYGLLTDLKRCASSMEETGEILSFEIGRVDQASRFRLPQILFGREKEERALREAFEQAISGSSSFVFVSGSAGSGKTVLIQELQKPVRMGGGRFIRGKCDVLNRDIPFSSLLQALRSLIRQVWSESPERLAKLKKQLTEELGQGAAVIVQLLPEAAELFDEIPAIELLNPAEAAIRFHRLVPIFIKVFVDKQHPLVIFLDDLQWADPATIGVLRNIVHDKARSGLLVIGAFREEGTPGLENKEGKVNAAAWIEETLSLHHESRLSLHHINLGPLSYIEVRQFVSCVLDENSARIRSLAEVLYHRTGGNPLYVNRLLDNLYRENKLYYNEEEAVWAWDTSVITQIPDDPDILHLIGARIRKLSPEKIELLAICAAIGYRFHSSTIALVSGYSLQAASGLLHTIEEEGLLCRENDRDEADGHEHYYTFLHDRIQQAAYTTMSESDKASLHLTIGRVIHDHLTSESEFTLFDMVYHMNLGSDNIVDAAEKRALAEYNYQAGLKSKETTAFAAALHFFEIGLRLSGDDWRNTASLAYRIMLEVPECEYICGHAERAEELLECLMSCTTDVVERSHIYLISIRMFAYLNDDVKAVEIGRQALNEFGWHLPTRASKSLIAKEVIMTQSALIHSRNDVLHLPINREPRYKALSDLVMAISTSIFTINHDLSVVLFSRFVRYGLKRGSNEAFSFLLASYGFVIYKVSRFYTGPQYIDKALQLASPFDSSDLLCRLYYLRGVVRLENRDEGVRQFEQSIHYGMESGNLSYVSLAMLTSTTTYIGDLQALSVMIHNYEQISRQLVDEVTHNIFRIARWYMAQLQDGVGEYDDFVTPLLKDRYTAILNNEIYYTCTCQIELAYLFGRYREALEWVEKGGFNTFRQTREQSRKQRMYHSLTLAAMYTEVPPSEQKSILVKLRKHLGDMKGWSGRYGKDSLRYLLLTAELHRIRGNRADAAQLYEKAIQLARYEGDELMEAISCERAAIYYRQIGSISGTKVFIADAYRAYVKWGATAKARKLREVYPELGMAVIELEENGLVDTDEPTAIKPKQELISWPVSDSNQDTEWLNSLDSCKTMGQFLESVIRYSGAEKGYMLSSDGADFFVEEAAAPVDEQMGASYAKSIVRYVMKTGEAVVLADASHSSYSADPSIVRSQSQSVLCMPVLFLGGLSPSVLYLENNLISDVFTKEKLELLTLMIARMMYLKSLEESHSQGDVPIHTANHQTAAAASSITSQSLIEPLTNREKEILYALTDGLSNKEIAYRFGLKESTVKGYIHNLYGKLGVKRRTQAIARANELELMN